MVIQARAKSMAAGFPDLDMRTEKSGEGTGNGIKISSEAEPGLPKSSCHAFVFLSFVSEIGNQSELCNRPDDISLKWVEAGIRRH